MRAALDPAIGNIPSRARHETVATNGSRDQSRRAWAQAMNRLVMNFQLPPDTFPPAATDFRSIVLYEDLVSAEAGISLACLLGSEVGLDLGCPDSHWLLNLIEVPRVASEILRQAVASTHVVLSLRGDGNLSSSVRRWIEEWLTKPHTDSVALVVLSGTDSASHRKAVALHRWLEQTAAHTKVELFFFETCNGEAVPDGADPEGDEEDEAEWFIGAVNFSIRPFGELAAA